MTRRLNLIERWQGRRYRRKHGRHSFSPVFLAAIRARQDDSTAMSVRFADGGWIPVKDETKP